MAGGLQVGLLVTLGADRFELGLNRLKKLEGFRLGGTDVLLKLEEGGERATDQGESHDEDAGAKPHG
jgi:hypothetical protein